MMDIDILNFYLLKYTNDYLILLFIAVVALVIYKIDRGRLLDYAMCIIFGGILSESIKYIVHSPRPIPMTGLSFEGGAFPSSHTTMAFAVFFFYFLCVKYNKSKANALKKYLASIFPKLKSFVDIKEGDFGLNGSFRVKNDILVVAIFLTALVIACLRIYTGAHYIIDVFAGIILGFLVSLPFVYYDISRRRI